MFMPVVLIYERYKFIFKNYLFIFYLQKTKYHERGCALSQEEEPQASNQNVGNANLQGNIKLATILMICFIAEHNLPFSISDHLTELCKVMFPDSAIAQGISMKRTKCTELTKKLADSVQEELAAKLRKNPFSVIIDESTDTSRTKCLTVIVKFFDADDAGPTWSRALRTVPGSGYVLGPEEEHTG